MAIEVSSDGGICSSGFAHQFIPNKRLDDSDFSELQFDRTFNASVSSGFLYCRAIYGGMIGVH